jgi:hypothetical protein
MRYFVDSSAVVKRYITEIGTPWFQNLVKSVNPRRLFVLFQLFLMMELFFLKEKFAYWG